MAEHCHIPEVKKYGTETSFYCWTLLIPYASTPQFAKSYMQHNLMNVITFLHNEVCYEVNQLRKKTTERAIPTKFNLYLASFPIFDVDWSLCCCSGIQPYENSRKLGLC